MDAWSIGQLETRWLRHGGAECKCNSRTTMGDTSDILGGIDICVCVDVCVCIFDISWWYSYFSVAEYFFMIFIFFYDIHIFLTFVSVCLYWRASNHPWYSLSVYTRVCLAINSIRLSLLVVYAYLFISLQTPITESVYLSTDAHRCMDTHATISGYSYDTHASVNSLACERNR